MLKGCVSLVTGAAGGLGRATCEGLLRCGARVAMLDLPTSKGKEISDQFGEDTLFTPANVTSEEEVSAALGTVEERWGRLDHVVNCAGISIAYATYSINKGTPMYLQTFTQPMMVNTVGTFNVCRLAVGLMEKNTPNKDNQRGVIINVSSTAAYEGQCSQAAFAASKAAISAMTLPMARDLSPIGIRVMAIAPGHFKTTLLTSQMSEKITHFLSSFQCSPRRLGEPEEFAELVLSVLKNPMLNGDVIRLDGGLRMHGRL